ncbi:MAG TPA: small, acid-soluble spore protein L [Bacillales bacterium]|nr:small, acid-soluble spore protein L [Bacillales bacterium]
MPTRHKEERVPRGKAASSVNPQGISPDKEAGNEPKNVLQDRAKKRNTKE